MVEPLLSLQVLTVAAGMPSLLEAQLSSLRKFFPASTKVLVVDDSRRRRHFSNNQDRNSAKRLRKVAEDNGAQYVRMPQHLHFMRGSLYGGPNPSPKPFSYPSLRHADSLQYGISLLGPSIRQLMILDSDMIPIAEFEPERYLAEAPVWFLPQERSGPNGVVVYPWPGIFLADLSKADVTEFMNWDCAVIDGAQTDTGGGMHSWMEANAHHVRTITGLTSGEWKWESDSSSIPLSLEEFMTFDAKQNNDIQFCELFMENFLHLRAGSNWEPAKRDVFQERLNLFTEGIKGLVND